MRILNQTSHVHLVPMLIYDGVKQMDHQIFLRFSDVRSLPERSQGINFDILLLGYLNGFPFTKMTKEGINFSQELHHSLLSRFVCPLIDH